MNKSLEYLLQNFTDTMFKKEQSNLLQKKSEQWLPLKAEGKSSLQRSKKKF